MFVFQIDIIKILIMKILIMKNQPNFVYCYGLRCPTHEQTANEQTASRCTTPWVRPLSS